MEICKVCSNTEFFKEAGYYFCKTCQTQNEDMREEVYDLQINFNTRVRTQKIQRFKAFRSGDNNEWTTWELYNFILVGLTDELVKLGITDDIKLTVLQLWTTYLGKLEVAFTSTTKKNVPKLSRKFHKRDAEIIYGKHETRQSRKRKLNESTRTSSLVSSYLRNESSVRELSKNKKLLIAAEYDRFIRSQGSSEGELSSFGRSNHSMQASSFKSSGYKERLQFTATAKMERKKIRLLSKKVPRKKRAKYLKSHVTTQYASSPQVITPMKLWAILYIALRIHNQPLQISDMLRYGREGHLSYYKLVHLLPPDVVVTQSDIPFLTQTVEMTHRGMRHTVANMVKFLGVWQIGCPDFLSLINRYCQELQLPRGILLYVERVIALDPPKMKFDKKITYFPNYEGRAMAFIVIVFKILFGLDDITEHEISAIANKINSAVNQEDVFGIKLFSFQEWQRYIECRKTVIMNSHFPTKLKYSPDSFGISSLYIKFLEFIHSKTEREEPKRTKYNHHMPQDLIDEIKIRIGKLNNDYSSTKEVDIFDPSLTPLHSYLQQLLENPLCDLPQILHTDFSVMKVGYTTKPEYLQQLASQYNLDIQIIDSSLNYIEKIVPHFEPTRIPNITELNQEIKIKPRVTTTNSVMKNEDFSDYIYSKIPFEIKLDPVKKTHYTEVQNSIKESEELLEECDDFVFSETDSNGKLLIPDCDTESKESIIPSTFSEEHKLSKTNLCQKYDLQLSCIEKMSVDGTLTNRQIYKPKTRPPLCRGSNGKFIKANEVSEIDSSQPRISTPLCNTFESTKYPMNIKLEGSNEEEVVNNDDVWIDVDDYINLGDISILEEESNHMKDNTNEKQLLAINKSEKNKETLKFFRPYKDYWMYHYVFSRVKPKNFELFEKFLPLNFRWLLNECAAVVEMTTQDLYEEVCTIEIYYAHISKLWKLQSTNNSYVFRTNIKNKW